MMIPNTFSVPNTKGTRENILTSAENVDGKKTASRINDIGNLNCRFILLKIPARVLQAEFKRLFFKYPCNREIAIL